MRIGKYEVRFYHQRVIEDNNGQQFALVVKDKLGRVINRPIVGTTTCNFFNPALTTDGVGLDADGNTISLKVPVQILSERAFIADGDNFNRPLGRYVAFKKAVEKITKKDNLFPAEVDQLWEDFIKHCPSSQQYVPADVWVTAKA